ncbi:uncharacterized protein LOC113279818 [Papaver somniferum]|uniref:uncharacterized protein LOC113279818 n=1 Tax=Papaver somniferum TaxID=3469 RepID=UPI000E6F6663|nr:uncharacterized protein LOC113279818 [Papaver somniferum]
MINELDTKRRGGNVGLKLDIYQAYDSLSWEFLFMDLKQFGFSDKFIKWIHILLKSSKISVLVNGGPVGYFNVSRGLRQGDPLSPLLFVMAEDVLSKKLSSMVLKGELFPWYDNIKPCMGICRNATRKFSWLERKNAFIPRKISPGEVCLMCYIEMGENLLSIITSGLGIRQLEVINKAMLMKMCWNMQNERIRWLVGDGNNISVWNDSWIKDRPLKDIFPENPIMLQNPDMKVRELINNGEWKIPVNFLEFFEPEELPVLDHKEDRRIWSATLTGNFSVASTSECIRKKYQPVKWEKAVWHKSIHPNISGNIWKLVRGVVPADEKMKKKKFQLASRCPFCRKEEENLEHILWYGYICRNWDGEYLYAMSGSLGIATNYMAEIVAVLCAGEWAAANNFIKVWFQTDSQPVMKAFQTYSVPWWSITRWNKIKSSLQEWHFSHGYREINFSADSMAKRGVNLTKGKKRSYTSRPEFLSSMEIPDKAYFRTC